MLSTTLIVLQELGIPTANISAEALGSTLSEAVTGIYYGWASLGAAACVYKTVMSVGFNPFYGNAAKTCEPWILHDFDTVRHASWIDAAPAAPEALHMPGNWAVVPPWAATATITQTIQHLPLLQDFYDEELRLVVCGYVRPEADFTTLEALKERILEDGEVTKQALEDNALVALAQDPFLRPS